MARQIEEYKSFEEPEVLEIDFDGPALDAYTLAHLNFTLHFISNKIALLDGLSFPDSSFRLFRRYYQFPFATQPQVVRLQVDKIETGSLHEVVTFLVATIYSDDAARAILQHLAANIIWAIGKSGLRGIRTKEKDNVPKELPPPDPFDIGPELGETIRHLSNNSKGKPCKLRFRRRGPDGKIDDLEIDINSQ